MTETVPTVSKNAGMPETLRAHFTSKAVLPERQIARAETFLQTLQQKAASGATLSEKDLNAGQKILRSLNDQTEVFGFNYAILAGQEAASESDLDQRLSAISSGLERAQMTSERLRRTLETLA